MTTDTEHKQQKQRAPSILSDFCLDRLFDPEDLYYVPMEELVKRYKKRDLAPGKLYNIAKKYMNGSNVRHRLIIAPPMEKLHHRYLDPKSYHNPAPKVYYCSRPNEKPTFPKIDESDKENVNNDNNGKTREQKFEEHNEWLQKRKSLRNNLDNMGLNPEYLKRKKDLTELEKRVLRRMLFIDKETQTEEIKEKRDPKKKYFSHRNPKITLPTPIAMQKIEEILGENKWRLVDLFRDLDKKKDWELNGVDLRRECNKLGITDAMLEELFMAYGSDEKKIDYKKLAKGRVDLLNDKRIFIKERRKFESEPSKPKPSVVKAKESPPNKFVDKEPVSETKFYEPPVVPTLDPMYTEEAQSKSPKQKPKLAKQKFSVESEDTFTSRQSSAYSRASSSDSKGFLKVPDIDSREEIYPPANTSNRGTSAPHFYSIKVASRPSSTAKLQKNKKASIPEMIVEFRNQQKFDAEKLRNAQSSIDLNEEQLKAFDYPREFSKEKIIAGLIDKKRIAKEKAALEEKLAWERKRLEMKLKLRKERL